MSLILARLDPITRDDLDVEDRMDEILRDRHESELQSYARELWHATGDGRDTLHRLQLLLRTARRVLASGPDERRESELKMNVLLDDWGPATTIKTFARLAEEEARLQERK